MKKTEFNNLGLSLYHETLDNGLNVFIVPMENVNNKYVTFTTKYGSTINEFIPIGENEYIKVPNGIAHFLEHKMFEQKDGMDPFSFYNKNGADINAYTSFFGTTYHFSGVSNFKENLNYLLDFVQDLYLTEENVEQEKGIIIEEIKMHKDNPYRRGEIGLITNSFNQNPIRIPIIGTEETVSSITLKELKMCYETFYNPSNMFLVITGNVDPEEIINIIKENQAKKTFKIGEIVALSYDEEDAVAISEEIIDMEVTTPKIFIGYKINYEKLLKKYSKDDIFRYLNIYMNIKFDATSNINQELQNKGIINFDIETDKVNTDKHILFMVIADTEKYDEFYSAVNKEINNKVIEEKDFIRKKRSYLSSNIYMSDSIYKINDKILGSFLSSNQVITDYYKIYEDLKLEKLNEIINEVDFTNVSKLIIK